MNRNEIMDHVGAENWEMVEDEFANQTPDQIKETLDEMFPADDNFCLAHGIYDAQNS